MADLESIERELRDALTPNIQVIRPLGRGAMGAVFLARDPALKRDIVVKVLAPELAHDVVARKRFAREAETAAAVSHPNVVDIFQVGELPRSGASYFVMRYAQGPTLGEALPLGTRVSQARCRRIVGEIASALAAAHARGLVHRDVKPSNIMLDGPAERVIVLDFGISAAASPERVEGEERLTSQGTSIGTPAYMSPEQAAGDLVTERSDVCSLGVVAYELLAGEPPFSAKTPVGLIAAHIKDVPQPIAKLRPDIDPTFATLVDRMLAKEPDERPSSDEIARALLPAVHVVEWPPPGLESYRGWGALAVNMFVVGAVVLPFDLMAGTPTSEPQRVLLDALLHLATVVLLSLGGVVLGIATNQMRRAQRSGYPMRVGMDAMLDREPDTAALLNGAGPFASLGATTGERWLARRRWAGSAKLAGAAVTVLNSILWAMGIVALGDKAAGDSMSFSEFAMIMLPVLFGLSVAAVLRHSERTFRRRLRNAEPVGRIRAVVPADLVAAWRASAGALLPRTEAPRRARAGLEIVEWSFCVLVVGAMAAIVGTSTAGIFGSVSPSMAPLNEYHYAQQRAGIVIATRQASIDSTLAAHVVPRTNEVVDTGAARVIATMKESAYADLSLVWRALAILPSPLPPELSAALDTAARYPALDALRRIAAAGDPPMMWYSPTHEITQERTRLDWRAANSVERLATRNAAAATLALSHGDTRDAVARARENIAIGRLLVREPLKPSYQRGLGIAANGAKLLQEIGIIANDRALTREAQGLTAAIDARRAVDRQLDWLSLSRMGAHANDTLLLALAGNERLLPVDRWTAAEAIAHGACWNSAEMRAGVAPERARMLDDAERRLHDIQRSGEWIALQREFLRTVDRRDAPSATRAPGATVFGKIAPRLARTMLCGS